MLQPLWQPVPAFVHLHGKFFSYLELPTIQLVSVACLPIAAHLQEETDSIFSVSSNQVVVDTHTDTHVHTERRTLVHTITQREMYTDTDRWKCAHTERRTFTHMCTQGNAHVLTKTDTYAYKCRDICTYTLEMCIQGDDTCKQKNFRQLKEASGL